MTKSQNYFLDNGGVMLQDEDGLTDGELYSNYEGEITAEDIEKLNVTVGDK